MIRIKVGDLIVAIPGHLIADAVMGSLPGFLTGTRAPQNAQEAMMKAGIKPLVSMALTAMHSEIVKKQLPVPAPDLKCKAAKANIVTYAVAYILGNATALADGQIFDLEGEETDGTLFVSGVTATTADVAAVTGDQPHARVASPVV
jgi:hypothetical protein